MRLVRFEGKNGPAWGVCRGESVHEAGNPFQKISFGKNVGPVKTLKLLAPCDPRKVVALAYNYKDLVGKKEKYDEPLVFFKSPSGVIGPREPVRIPVGIETVWVEVELAFVIKKKAKNVPVSRAKDFILGYTVANDVTALNVHGRDWHLARSKALDTFCPTSPFLETETDARRLSLTTEINGRLTQNGTTANRIFDDARTLSFVSRFFTLEPGDLVLTGTPAGARQSLVRPGDTVKLKIGGLGELVNRIERAA
ncbi:MAG: fumarylacetoacetate hydrolase family protein [Candidatus Omnitrophica bacterium]|nr:fumarylacetoacetate hydrolase family protein [Candidatus Omnitrophota bacterium]